MSRSHLHRRSNQGRCLKQNHRGGSSINKSVLYLVGAYLVLVLLACVGKTLSSPTTPSASAPSTNSESLPPLPSTSDGLSPTPGPLDDCQDDNSDNQEESGEEEESEEDSDIEPASDDDGEEEELDDDIDIDTADDRFESFPDDKKSVLFDKLPLDLDQDKVKKLKKCVYEDPLPIQRSDGAVLDPAKMTSCIKKFRNLNTALNPGGVGCSPGHPGMMCVVHINCPSPTEDVNDISMVRVDTYRALQSAIALRANILSINWPWLKLKDTTKRGFFYWEKRKVSTNIALPATALATPPDRGLYLNQKQAEADIALLSNLLCVQTPPIYRSSTKSTFYGPSGVTIVRPELINTPSHVAHVDHMPFGDEKGYVINAEWHFEYNRIVTQRVFTNFDQVKCIVLVEKESVFEMIRHPLSHEYKCFTVLTGGAMNRFTVMFIHAIKARDPQDKIPIFTFSDMDHGGLKIAHQLSKDWNVGNIRFGSRSLGDYLHLRYQTCWMGVYPAEYHRLNNLHPSGVFKPMTMDDAEHVEILAWRNANQQDIVFAGNGPRRLAEIDRMLQERILFDIAKIPPSILVQQLGNMLDNAICPDKWENRPKHSNLKPPPSKKRPLGDATRSEDLK